MVRAELGIPASDQEVPSGHDGRPHGGNPHGQVRNVVSGNDRPFLLTVLMRRIGRGPEMIPVARIGKRGAAGAVSGFEQIPMARLGKRDAFNQIPMARLGKRDAFNQIPMARVGRDAFQQIPMARLGRSPWAVVEEAPPEDGEGSESARGGWVELIDRWIAGFDRSSGCSPS